MARTRRVRLYCSDHRCKSGFAPVPRTSHESPASETRLPFSRSSTGPAAANSRRLASSSDASSMRRLYKQIRIPACISAWRRAGFVERNRAESRGEEQSGHAKRRWLRIPHGRNVFDGNFNIRAAVRQQRGRAREHVPGFLQDYLMDLIVKLRRDLNALQRPVPVICKDSVYGCDFLVQKVFCPAKRNAFDANTAGIGLLRRAERQAHTQRRRSLMMNRARPKQNECQHDGRGHNDENQEPRAAVRRPLPRLFELK